MSTKTQELGEIVEAWRKANPPQHRRCWNHLMAALSDWETQEIIRAEQEKRKAAEEERRCAELRNMEMAQNSKAFPRGTESCSTCRFWWTDGITVGRCRRFPPLFDSGTEKWPYTKGFYWCGEHKPISPPPNNPSSNPSGSGH